MLEAKARSRSPRAFAAAKVLARHYLDSEQYEDAVRVADIGLGIDPLYDGTRLVRAHAYERSGDYESAMEDFRFVHEQGMDPVKRGSATLGIARCLAAAGDWSGVTTLFNSNTGQFTTADQQISAESLLQRATAGGRSGGWWITE